MIRTLNEISKIELYQAPKGKGLRACDVRKKTGADVVINGTLYDPRAWRPVCDVKAAGKVLSDDPYSYRGLAWNSGDTHFTVAVSKDMPHWSNFISCVFLINNGEALPIEPSPDVARPAARTAVFSTADGKTHLWCDKKSMKPEELTKALLQRGARWALMLDGGGSSQLSQPGTEYIYSSRAVQNYLCFWEKKVEPRNYRPVVQAYSLAEEGNKQLSEHFLAREFRCRDNSDPIFVADMLVTILEDIRKHFGKPVQINSGYRTVDYNKSIGGASRSKHCLGLAADIVIPGVSPESVAQYARQLMPNFGGVGIYDTFTHIDVRKQRADWRG